LNIFELLFLIGSSFVAGVSFTALVVAWGQHLEKVSS